MSDKIEIGREGENLAAEFLKNKGWEIISRNYRYGKAEIDLIIKRDDWTIFVEVKTRSSSTYGEPEEFVDEFKARRIYDAAEEYIFATNWLGHVRFDVISIKLGSPPEIIHFEDAIN
ncbi:YraN family protein [Chryseolinea sp. H1M3-3]|uniref:YraN family protein n=1 Tax=Chryseolinea sp. H1M3-3 TaxID=3034144 RepID=UPI0023ED3A6F|nr:YraN family protein [Chryseolinea sp. H1M3-3]